MGNPAERFNQTLLKMLGTLEVAKKADWKSFLGPIVQAYNGTKSDATGFSPHFIMFGWHPRLPIDAALGSCPENEGSTSPSGYVQKLKSRLQHAYKLAAEASEKQAAHNKANYDRKVSASKLEVGDRVLIRRVHFEGRHKLVDRWDSRPYVVSDIPQDGSPVYVVRPEDGKGTKKTLHRNLLLPVNGLSLQNSFTDISKTDISREFKKSKKQNPVSNIESDSESSSSSGSDTYIIPQRRSHYRPNWVRNEPSTIPNRSGSELHSHDSLSVDCSQNDSVPVLSRKEVQTDNTNHSVTIAERNISHTTINGSNDPVPELSQSNSGPPVEPVRRSGRSSRAPDRYGEWVKPITATYQYLSTGTEDEIYV
jgi:hypothetical protein